MTGPFTPVVGKPYLLQGLHHVVWDNKHPQYDQPSQVAAIYLGALQGTRLWHLFEIRVERKDAGVILMNDGDLQQTTVTPL